MVKSKGLSKVGEEHTETLKGIHRDPYRRDPYRRFMEDRSSIE